MTFHRPRVVLAGAVGWCCVSLLGLTALGFFTPGTYGLVSLMGTILVVEYASPRLVTPRWYSRSTYVLYLSLVLVATYVVYRHLSAFP